MNLVILHGRLGKDPESKALSNGTAVCNFSMATSETWKDKSGQKQEKVEWTNISVFGSLAENCTKYLHKGSEVLVQGSLETRSWEKDGVKHYATGVKASNVQFLGGKNEGIASKSAQITEEDLPF